MEISPDNASQQRKPLLQLFSPASVVVFRALQLGDMLCAVPALRALRLALPHSRIALVGLPWAGQFVSRFRHYIDDFLPFPGHPSLPEQPVHQNRVASFYRQMRHRSFDLALQMHGSGKVSNQVVSSFQAVVTAGFRPDRDRTGKTPYFMPYPESGPEPLRMLRLVEFLGAPPAGSHLEFPLTADDDEELERFHLRESLPGGSYICIHPGARRQDECWPAQRFAAVADQLAKESGLQLVLTGSVQERDITDAVASHMRTPVINAALPLSLGARAALLSRARLLICNDSGVSHIAAALQVPSIVIFSKSEIARWSPLDESLHRCIWDPEAKRSAQVLEHARELLRATGLTLTAVPNHYSDSTASWSGSANTAETQSRHLW